MTFAFAVRAVLQRTEEQLLLMTAAAAVMMRPNKQQLSQTLVQHSTLPLLRTKVKNSCN
jgi:hypothetical protein